MKIKMIILSTMSVLAMSAFAGESLQGKDLPPPPLAQKQNKEGFKPQKNQPHLEKFAREGRPEFQGHHRISKEEKLEGVIKDLLVVNALQSKIIMDLVQLDKPLLPPPGFEKEIPHGSEERNPELQGRPPLPKEEMNR